MPLILDGLLGPFLLLDGLTPATGDLMVALRARLLGESALDDLTDIYLNKTRPTPTYPFLVLNVITAMEEINNSVNFYEEIEMQFTVAATDDAQAETLGKAARKALHTGPGVPPLNFADGYEMARLPVSWRLTEQTGVGPQGRSIWLYQFTMHFLVGRNP